MKVIDGLVRLLIVLAIIWGATRLPMVQGYIFNQSGHIDLNRIGRVFSDFGMIGGCIAIISILVFFWVLLRWVLQGFVK